MTENPTSVTVLTAATPVDRRGVVSIAAQLDTATDFGKSLHSVLDGVARGETMLLIRSHQEVTPAGAAQMLGVTRQYVDRLLANGTLPFRRLPSSVHRRVAARDVTELIEQRRRR